MFARHTRLLVAASLLGASLQVAAETLYVTDRLRAAIHAEQSAESPVLALVESGTKLEALEQVGEFTRVRTAEGVEGWVDAVLLTEAMPAVLLLAESAQAQRLSDLQSLLEELKQRVASERLRGGELEKRLAEAERAAKQPPAAAVGDLAAENARLLRELEEARRAEPADASGLSLTVTGLVVLVLALAGFGAGVWLSDWRSRRRHGGFRV